MITINVEGLGEFSAENEEKALKMVKKARKDFNEKKKIEESDKQQARFRAYENAYYLYDRKMSGNAYPQGWRVFYRKDLDNIVHNLTRGTDTFTFESPDGRCESEHYGVEIQAVLENGAGFQIGAWFKDLIGSCGRVEFCAVGVYKEQISFQSVYGFDPTDFSCYEKKE